MKKGWKRNVSLLMTALITMAISAGWGGTLAAQAAPAADLVLSAELQDDMTVNLTWNDPYEDELGYIVERKLIDSADWTEVTNAGRQATSYHDTTVLEEGLTYQYRIKCTHNLTKEVAYSNIEEVAKAIDIVVQDYYNNVLAAPTDLMGEAIFYENAEDRIQLTWSVNETQNHFTVIERRVKGASDWDIMATLPGNTHLWEDMNNLVLGTVYQYRAKAVGEGNSTAHSDYTGICEVAFGESLTPPTTGTILKFIMNSTMYYIDDVAYQMDMKPYIYNNRCFLPVTYIIKPLGGTATWDGSEQKIIIGFHGQTIELWVGSNNMRVNGVDDVVDSNDPTITPVIVPPGRVVVPVRVVSEAMQCYTTWDQANLTATIQYPNPNNP